MKYFYGEYDGEEFPTQDKLFGFDQLMQFIMQYVEQALKVIEQKMEDGKNKIRFDEHDFELHLHEGVTSCSTVVLLDMSGSMMRYGRFLAAKKVALAMQALVRGKFPQDSLDFVGFYSGAARIPEIALPLVMPKPVTVYDYQVRLRVPLGQIDRAPQHFTNLHMGLQMARRVL